MGHLLYGSSLLGSCLPFPLPSLQECRTFEIHLHSNDYSWCSPAMCACGCQSGVWTPSNILFTYGVPSRCTRCRFLHWCTVGSTWSCHIRNSAGTCCLDVGEGMNVPVQYTLFNLSSTSGVARAQPMPGHSMGTLRLSLVPRPRPAFSRLQYRNAEATRGVWGMLPQKILDFWAS